jgi:hypothetical protein
MIPLVAIGWIHLMFVLVLLNIHEICLKLKSGFRIIHKFPTITMHISKYQLRNLKKKPKMLYQVTNWIDQ